VSKIITSEACAGPKLPGAYVGQTRHLNLHKLNCLHILNATPFVSHLAALATFGCFLIAPDSIMYNVTSVMRCRWAFIMTSTLGLLLIINTFGPSGSSICIKKPGKSTLSRRQHKVSKYLNTCSPLAPCKNEMPLRVNHALSTTFSRCDLLASPTLVGGPLELRHRNQP
jgi:hypothetical protein